MKKKIEIIIVTVLLLICVATYAYAKVTIVPRVAGLENNSEYMELLAVESRLHMKEDSLTKEVTKTRGLFRDIRDEREHYRAEILRLEGEIFDVRNHIGIITSKVGAIEEQFIINNLNRDAGQSDGMNNSMQERGGLFGSQINGNSSNSPNLIYNDFFRLKLPADDYATLLSAQNKEQTVSNFTTIYLTNYKTMSNLYAQYHKTDNQESADSVMSQYRSLEQINMVVEDTIAKELTYILDNKLYAYNYLLDRINAMELLSQFEQKINQAMDKKVELKRSAHSVTIASYPIYKELVFEYESLFAKELKLSKAVDSLERAKNALRKIDFEIPKIEMIERLFLEFSDVSVQLPAKYNYSNPIPECEVYERGVIYRILIGNYTRRQAVSVFKGVYPLGYIKSEDNRYQYYAGGFYGLSAAIDALELVHKAGFINAKIALWNYGTYSVLDDQKNSSVTTGGDETLFRVEISGAGDDLSHQVKETIEELIKGKDILRIDDMFVISSFESSILAETVADRIRAVNRGLIVKVNKVPL